MQTREFQSFEPAVHVSGWTYMKCPFCFKRINIQESVVPLEKPESYGVENPEQNLRLGHLLKLALWKAFIKFEKKGVSLR